MLSIIFISMFLLHFIHWMYKAWITSFREISLLESLFLNYKMNFLFSFCIDKENLNTIDSKKNSMQIPYFTCFCTYLWLN